MLPKYAAYAKNMSLYLVPEESWYGQPKKNHPTLCRFLLLIILHFICEAEYIPDAG